MSGTNSNDNLPLKNLLKKLNPTGAKLNAVAARSASSKELPDPNSIIPTLLETLKKKLIKQKRFLVDLDSLDLYNSVDESKKTKRATRR